MTNCRKWIPFDGDFYDLPQPRVGLQIETSRKEWFLIGDMENSSSIGGCGCCSDSLCKIVRYRRLVPIEELTPKKKNK